MKIAVLGATGLTGLQFVLEALENEHEVIALVRNPDGLSSVKNAKLQVKQVNIFKEEDLVEFFKYTDVVVSCLGCRTRLFGWFSDPITFYLDTIKPIVGAMRTANKKRIVCMSSYGTVRVPDESKVMTYFLRPLILSKILKSMAEMEDYLQQSCSDIDYTIVRPPGLTNGQSSGKKIEAAEGQFVPNGGNMIPRRDVAKFMLECATSQEWKKKCVAIALDS